MGFILLQFAIGLLPFWPLSWSFSSIIGSQEYLRKHYGLDAASIAAAVSRLVKTCRG